MRSTVRGILMVLALVAASCGGDGDATADDVPSTSAASTTTAAASTSTTVAPAETTTTTTTTTTTLPPGDGTPANPYVFDMPAAVRMLTADDSEDDGFISDTPFSGSVWNVTVGAPYDVTADVLAAESGGWNVEPPDGVVYAGFDASMTLASADAEPLRMDLDFRWRIIGGATGEAYSELTIETLRAGCGFLPDAFGRVVYVGGTMQGVACVPIPAEDLGHPDTRVELDQWGDAGTVFGSDGGRGPVADIVPLTEIGTGSGEGTRAAPYAFDTAVTAPGRSGTEIRLVIGPPSDITDAVLAADPANPQPGEGLIYVGYEVEVTLVAGSQSQLPAQLVTWTIAGGVENRRYFIDSFTPTPFGGPDDPDAPYDWGCGVAPDGFDDFADLAVGATATGVVCIPLPVEEFEHPDTQVSVRVSSSGDLYFA